MLVYIARMGCLKNSDKKRHKMKETMETTMTGELIIQLFKTWMHPILFKITGRCVHDYILCDLNHCHTV